MATTPEHMEAGRPLRDSERDGLVARLRTECTEGRITLDEFSDLVGDVFAADTRADLDRVERMLAPIAPAVPAPFPHPSAEALASARDRVARAARALCWLVAVFGESTKRGRFKLDEPTTAVAVFGECKVDLADATIEGGEAVIEAVAVFGDIVIVVPDGIDVVLEGFSFFGSRRCDVGAEVLPGSPVVVVRAFACFGDVRVRSPRASSRRGRS